MGDGHTHARTREGGTPPSETPSDAETDVAGRRSHVVGRLLALGVTAGTLQLLLPDWEPVIAEAHPLQRGNPT